MRLSFAIALLMAASCAGYAQEAVPRITSVEPANGKPGDVIAVSGENLEKDTVAKVYLTDGKNDTLVEVVDQSAKGIKFKIPATAKPSRLSIMVLTAGKDAKYIEQPVKVQIDAP
jgi:hypothetical protein